MVDRGARQGILVGAVVAGAVLAWGACSDDVVPDGPEGVSASDGTSAEQVVVTWTAVEHADAYRVWRDGELVGTTAGTQYFDRHAAPASATPPVLTASAGTSTEGVVLSWTPSSVGPGPRHHYAVSAVIGNRESARSATDEGFRGVPELAYEVSRDGGTTFDDVGTALELLDSEAPLGVIGPGTVTASDGAFDTHIAVALTGASVAPGAARTYQIRVAGTAAHSNLADGYRGVGALTYQWERSHGTPHEIAGATSPSIDDDHVPPGVLVRHWCRLSASGTAPLTDLPSDTGWRRHRANERSRSGMWVPDGTVNAIAANDQTIFVGGNFTRVAVPTGSIAAIDAATGVPAEGRPRLQGVIKAAISDASGRLYVGGELANHGGTPVGNLVRLTADGELDAAFAPPELPDVTALVLDGNTLFVAHVEGIAAIAVTTGSTAWSADLSGVASMQAAGGKVIVAGSFTAIGGQVRNGLGALDATTGAVSSWNPQPDAAASRLVVIGDTVYVIGAFTTIGGQARMGLAAIAVATGAATTWTPAPDGWVNSIVARGDTVYVAGTFTTIGGQPRAEVAALDAATGLARTFQATAGPVRVLAADASTVYMASAVSYDLIAADAVTGETREWNPRPSGVVNVAVPLGDTVYLGGEFATAGGVPRARLAAFDAVTGELLDWNPGANNRVLSLALTGNTLYVGGLFSAIAGQDRLRLAAFDLGSGELTGWDPGANERVWTLAVHDDTLYAGGFFTSIGGQARSYLAAFDVASGQVTSFDPAPNSVVLALAFGATTIYAGGDFTSIGGAARMGLAALDLAGEATPWQADTNHVVSAIAVASDTVYVGGRFSMVAGVARERIAAVDATTGAPTGWNPGVYGGTVEAFAVSGGMLFVGGGFIELDGLPRSHLAAVELASGTVTPWNPSPGQMAGTLGGGLVSVLVARGAHLYVGGGFDAATGKGLLVLAP
jgi:hypothetical protein